MAHWPTHDPDEVRPYLVVWCDRTGLNDGSALDRGALQGATISSYTVTVPDGLTLDSDTDAAVVVGGVSYAIHTVIQAWISGGTAGTTYEIVCQVVTSDGRTLEQTIYLPVAEK